MRLHPSLFPPRGRELFHPTRGIIPAAIVLPWEPKKQIMKHRIILLITVFVATLLAPIASAQSGTWTKKSYSISGKWEIVKEGKQYKLKLESGFKTRSAPDLKLFLSKKPLASLNNRNATQGAVLIAKLKSPKGSQEYVLPAGVDPSQYKTLILHCQKFSKLWGGATL